MNRRLHIIEHNELIAQFTGLMERLPLLYDLNPANLSYDHSMDSLMRVVEYIECLGYPVTIVGQTCQIHGRPLFAGTTKIEAVYTAVVDFIKWYNQIKNKIA